MSDVIYVFNSPVNNGDRPIQIIFADGQKSNPVETPEDALLIAGILDERSFHEYDYEYQDGSIIYSSQPLPGSSLVPNPRLLQSLVMADANISVEAKANLMQYFALLDQNVDNLPGLRSGWQILKAAYGQTWLTSDIQTLVESYSVQANMPLTE